MQTTIHNTCTRCTDRDAISLCISLATQGRGWGLTCSVDEAPKESEGDDWVRQLPEEELQTTGHDVDIRPLRAVQVEMVTWTKHESYCNIFFLKLDTHTHQLGQIKGGGGGGGGGGGDWMHIFCICTPPTHTGVYRHSKQANKQNSLYCNRVSDH